MKKLRLLGGPFQTTLSESLWRWAILSATTFIFLFALFSLVVALIYYRLLPFLPEGTATMIIDTASRNILPILGILFVPSAIGSWWLTRTVNRNRQLKRRLEVDEQVLEMLDDSIYVHTVDGNRLYASKPDARDGGATRTKLKAKDSVYDKLIRPRIPGLMKSGEVTWESTHSTEDATVPVEVRSRVIATDNRDSILSIVRDITERKQNEEKLRQSAEKLQRAMNSTINSMASLAEARDPYTAGHQQRVAKLATAIARELNLLEEQIEGIRVAGTLHDIGKISVPAEILSKPGRLRKSEFELVKDHAEIGYGLLKMIEFSQPVAQIVLQHHERMDGSGYPGGLTGEQILIEARIMGVADVIESMSSHRPYRPAYSIEKALLEIIMKKGVLYDTKAVEACVSLFNEKNFTFD
jgi:putative nucleotidyltransferase with HDIG domain/PAS domain S-box-containing protein